MKKMRDYKTFLLFASVAPHGYRTCRYKTMCLHIKLCMVVHQQTTGDMDCFVHYTLYVLLVTTRQT